MIRQGIHAAAPYSDASAPLAGTPRARRVLTLHDVDSRAELESRLDRSTPIFCYPNGAPDARVRHGASRHFDAASSAEALIGHHPADDRALPSRPVSSDLGLSVWRLHSRQS